MKRWTSVFAWLASMVILWAVVVPDQLSTAVFTALASLGVLALSTMVLLAERKKARSITQVLDDLDAEPLAVEAEPGGRR